MFFHAPSILTCFSYVVLLVRCRQGPHLWSCHLWSCHVVIAHPFHLRQQILGSALMLFSNQAADALLRNSVPYGIEVKDIQVDQMGAPNWTSFPNAVNSRSSSSCYIVACSPIQPLHQFPSTELSGSKLCILLPCSNQAWLWMIPHLHPLTNHFPKLSKCLAFPLPGCQARMQMQTISKTKGSI